MKAYLTPLIIVAGTMIALASFVAPPYNNSKPPSLSLPTAYERAMNSLGTATNRFHCISAKVATTFSADGEWSFTFSSTNGVTKWVAVEFNGKTHIEDVIIR